MHRQRVARLLAPDSPFRRVDGRLELVGVDYATRTAALAAFVDGLVQQGQLRPPLGEHYPVMADMDPAPLLQVDRTAVAWLGVRSAGVHLNGYVRGTDGLRLWVAERSRRKRSYPGYLDNLVAGGSAVGLTPRETLVKECGEEAGMPVELAAGARAVGNLAYVMQDDLALKPDRLDLFDLELPASFTPRPVDGEVERFELWPRQRVVESLAGDGLWKPNCALVVIDFLLRHGGLEDLPAPERWRLWRRLRGG